MSFRRCLLGICAFLGISILILDGETAVQGAYEGIILNIRTVIPSLFPFFLLSNIITTTYMGANLPILRPFKQICSIPDGMESILIPAFLGGYPVGTQAIVQQWQQQQISRKDAQRLMGFCNNPGPSFIFGMAASLFPNIRYGFALWIIQITSALIVARLIPGSVYQRTNMVKQRIQLTAIIQNAVKAMCFVCGWVIQFRILITFLDKWILWALPDYAQAAIIGVLELSNGCIALLNLHSIETRFILCSGMLTFGGLCVIMQITSAANGLSLQCFFRGKCIQTVLSLLMASCFIYRKFLLWAAPIFILLLLPRKIRKNGSIPMESGV